MTPSIGSPAAVSPGPRIGRWSGVKSIVAAQILRRPRPAVTGTNAARRVAHRLVHRPVDRARLAGPVVRVAPAEEQPALLEPPVQPGADVEDHRLALDGEGLVRLEDRDGVADRPGRDPDPGERAPTVAEARPAGQDHPLGRDRAGARLDADDAAAAARRRLDPEARERRPLAELDAGRLHRERVGPDVARRVDVAVGLEEAAAAVAGRGEGRDLGGGLGGRQPADGEALAPAASRRARGRRARPRR